MDQRVEGIIFFDSTSFRLHFHIFYFMDSTQVRKGRKRSKKIWRCQSLSFLRGSSFRGFFEEAEELFLASSSLALRLTSHNSPSPVNNASRSCAERSVGFLTAARASWILPVSSGRRMRCAQCRAPCRAISAISGANP